MVSFFGYDEWLQFFDETGFISYCSVPKPTESVTVYRGCTPGFRNGMSWTPDIEVADWFNERYEDRRGESAVYETVIQPEWVLATLEAKPDVLRKIPVIEYVIDPRFLKYECIHKVNLFNKLGKEHCPKNKFHNSSPYLKMKKGRGKIFESMNNN